MSSIHFTDCSKYSALKGKGKKDPRKGLTKHTHVTVTDHTKFETTIIYTFLPYVLTGQIKNRIRLQAALV
jgi:hypothetical protein